MMQCVCDICGKVISNCVDDIRTHIFNMKRGNTDYGVKSTDASTEILE